MATKFISLDDAAEQLGISKERLNGIREKGDLRAYRDGASWKFRTEEIDSYQVEKEAVEEEAPAEPAEDVAEDIGMGLSAESSLELESLDLGLDDTSTEEVSVDEDLVLGVEPLGEGDDAESILLTEGELEGGLTGSPSTIIGRSELSLEDDLELAGSSSAVGAKEEPQPVASFDDVEELELDLEAESSRILGAQDVAAAQVAAAEAAAKQEPAAGSSDLTLDDEFELDLEASDASVISGSDPADAGGGSKTGEISPGSVAGLSGLDTIQLGEDEQDDMVLGGSDDFSLSSSDSGINLNPSDSGIALDEVPLDLGGSALGSALDLAALSAASAISAPLTDEASSAPAEDLLLTPVEDDEAGGGSLADLDDLEEEDEVVAFIPEGEEEDEEEDAFSFSEASQLGGDLGMAGASAIGAAGVGVAAAGASVVATADTTFPTGIMILLGCSLLTMTLCGIMALDLINSMWSWSEPYSVNSAIMDGILGLFGG